jgi:AbrB family looped-hinge helix DNA binding protein
MIERVAPGVTIDGFVVGRHLRSGAMGNIFEVTKPGLTAPMIMKASAGKSRGMIFAMEHGVITTIDASGRLVLPREIRDEAQLEPGMPLRITCRDGRVEIEPAPREVDVVRKGRMRVAVPAEEGAVLRSDTVRETTASVRGRRR